MGHIAVFAAAALLGVDTGWEPLPEGGLVYIIQIRPEVVDGLKTGEIPEVSSDIRRELRGVRSYRIVVGDDPLPRVPPLEQLDALRAGPAEQSPAEAPADGQPSGGAPPAAPHVLPDGGQGRPIAERPAAFETPVAQPSGKKPTQADAGATEGPRRQEPIEAGKPWLPLMLVCLGLFASLGANAYLGWITVELRSRYRRLLRKTPEMAVDDDASA